MTRIRFNDGIVGVIPYEAIGDGATRTLLAVLSLPRPTVRAVATRAGFRSTSTAWAHLKALRVLGLVDFQDSKTATTRALVRIVPKMGSVEVKGEWWG